MWSRSKVGIVLILLVFLTGTFGTAMAEGARYSSMYDVYTGFNFRNFTDYNNDGTSTWAELAYCRGQNPNYSVWGISLDLWRVNNWAPDDNYGGNVASYNW